MHRTPAQRGQTSAEYLGVVVVVAVVIAGLAATGFPQRVGSALTQTVCRIVSLGGCGSAEAAAEARDAAGSNGSAPTFGTSANDWDADSIDGIDLPPSGATPEEVRAFFDRLDPEAQAALAAKYPEIIGNLDGAPPEVRYAANRINIMREVERLEREGGDAERIERLRAMASEDRQIILFDPSGDGRAAEVFGDLDAAEHVAVLVPGATNTLDTFDGFNDSAELLHTTTSELWPDRPTATIAWLGYDTPDSLPFGIPFPGPEAIFDESADQAATTLPPFLEGINQSGRHVTVIGHSYGSVAVGLAAREGLAADDIVFLGSPGVRARNATELGHNNVWAGLNPNDPIRFVDNVSVLGAGHGPQPAHGEFGARRFRTDGAGGHAYYVRDSEAVNNMARIIVGSYDEASLCSGTGDECD
jgi:hypothetical protein